MRAYHIENREWVKIRKSEHEVARRVLLPREGMGIRSAVKYAGNGYGDYATIEMLPPSEVFPASEYGVPWPFAVFYKPRIREEASRAA